jgi:hypothetical protein
MSLRCTELGVQLSYEACGPATKPFFCPTASAPFQIHACGQVTAFCPTASAPIHACAQGTAFCPTSSAPFLQPATAEIDFAPLRAKMREALGH